MKPIGLPARSTPSRVNLRSGLECSVRNWVIKKEQLEGPFFPPEEPKWTHSLKPYVDFNKGKKGRWVQNLETEDSMSAYCARIRM